METRRTRSSIGLIGGIPPEHAQKNDENNAQAMAKGVVVVVCLIALVEGMDIVLIGASQQAFFDDVNGWTLFVAGWLGMGQGITQNMGAIFWGITADRGYMKRKNILCFAAFAQGLCTFSLAFISTIPPMWPIRLANGFFLAALRPISNGVVADLADPKDQGHYFGLMQGFFNFGTTFTGMIVGPVAESEYMIPIFGETDGWRISFAAVSSAAFVGSVLSYLIMPEIPAAPLTEEEKQQGVCETIVTEIKAMLKFLKYPSFVLMICQGIFGSIPWIVLGNMNLYVRLSGWEQWTLFWLGLPGVFGVVGGFLGGLVSDTLTAKFGPRGRPATAMLTVAFGIPLQFMLWYGIPPGSALQTLWVFMVINALFNLLANWAQPGCNFPVLGQIVTGKDRNKVLCWEMAFENTMATIIGSNAVPILIRWLGSEDIEYNDEPDLDQARALGTAQAIIVCVPWMICFCVYSGLLWAFPYDLKRKEAEESVDNTELVQAASL